jgi:hypothetical protein
LHFPLLAFRAPVETGYAPRKRRWQVSIVSMRVRECTGYALSRYRAIERPRSIRDRNVKKREKEGRIVYWPEKQRGTKARVRAMKLIQFPFISLAVLRVIINRSGFHFDSGRALYQ